MSPPAPDQGARRAHIRLDRPSHSPGAEVRWVACAALAFVCATAFCGIDAMATENDISPIGLATYLFGAIGVALALAALLAGAVRAVRGRQWRWVVAIVLGTALPLPAATQALAVVAALTYGNLVGRPLNYSFSVPALAYFVGLACTPVTVAIYSVVGVGRTAGAASQGGRGSAHSDARAWLGAVGLVAAIALTLVAYALAVAYAYR